jgi:hypothetical protein
LFLAKPPGLRLAYFSPSRCRQGPWRKLALDIAGKFVAAPQHQRYLIVAVDYYSKWPEVGMCDSPTTAAVTDFLTGLFERFGLVEEITTDNGVQFTSTEFADFLQAHGIRHTRSALYSSEANAEVERFNRVIKDGLKAVNRCRSDISGRSSSVAGRTSFDAARHHWSQPGIRLARFPAADASVDAVDRFKAASPTG